MDIRSPRFQFFSSRLFWWIAFALGMSFFMFSFDRKSFNESQGNIAVRAYNAIYMPRLERGIDLQGGVRLVLGIDLDQAAANRLGLAERAVEKAFKRAKVHHTSRTFTQEDGLTFTFKDATHARQALDAVKDQFTELAFTTAENRLVVKLAKHEDVRVRSSAVESSVNTLSTRLDTFNVRGLTVSPHGEHQVVVQLPGFDDAEEVKSNIMRAAQLEFKIVEKVKSSKDAILDEFDYDLPSDRVIVPGFGEDDSFYLVSAFPDLTGDQIVDAHLAYDDHGRPCVAVKLSNEGGHDFKELTRDHVGGRLGIVMDGVMISAPTINSELGSNFQITGQFTIEAVSRLVSLLRSGSLLVKPTLETENVVGSSLGKDSIKKGLNSCLLALTLLFCFSVFYYGWVGVFAFIALLYNLFLTLLFLSYFKATLTLPGIAGMVLTIGMAIDFSIIIYEQIREEIQNGLDMRSAITKGFSGAMAVILDSNITTLIAGLVLFQYGGPAIRGFAVTLILGIIATLISGVFFLQSIFDYVLNYTKIRNLKF